MFQVYKKLAIHFSKKHLIFRKKNDANRAKIRNHKETEYSKRKKLSTHFRVKFLMRKMCINATNFTKLSWGENFKAHVV